MKVTQWFPAHVKPVHEGWYETFPVDKGSNRFNWYWGGGRWGFWDKDEQHFIACEFQQRTWRGLVKPSLSFVRTNGSPLAQANQVKRAASPTSRAVRK